MRVLLLDEDIASAEAFRKVIGQCSFLTALDCAQSPEQLLLKHKKFPANLIFIHLGSTTFNGLAAAKRLLEADAGAKVIFIAHSGDYALYAYEVGAVDYMLEPIDNCRLVKTICLYGGFVQ